MYRSIYKSYKQGEGQLAGWGGSLLIQLGASMCSIA